MAHMEWIWAAVAFGSGLLFGEIAGRIMRSALQRRGGQVAEAAASLGTFVFWSATAVGLVVAIAIIDASVLDDLGERLSEQLPRFLVAFLLLIAGYAVSVAVAATIGQSARKATGVRQAGLERVLRVSIMVAATVVALTELGVDASVLVVLLAAAIGAPALAVATAHRTRRQGGGIPRGSRPVATTPTPPRTVLGWGDDRGTIVVLHPSTVEVERSDGTRVLVPNQHLLRTPFTSRTARPPVTESLLWWLATSGSPPRQSGHTHSVDPSGASNGSNESNVQRGPRISGALAAFDEPSPRSTVPPSLHDGDRVGPTADTLPTCCVTSCCWSSTDAHPWATSTRSLGSCASSRPGCLNCAAMWSAVIWGWRPATPTGDHRRVRRHRRLPGVPGRPGAPADHRRDDHAAPACTHRRSVPRRRDARSLNHVPPLGTFRVTPVTRWSIFSPPT